MTAGFALASGDSIHIHDSLNVQAAEMLGDVSLRADMVGDDGY
jgi:hypothetical protein